MSAAFPRAAPASSTDWPAPEIIVLDGDQAGLELLEPALRVLDPSEVRVSRFLANPMAMILARAARLAHVPRPGTTDFTGEVIRHASAKLEVWTTLA